MMSLRMLRWVLLIVVGLVLGGFALNEVVTAVFGDRPASDWTVERLEQLIEAELPLGCTRAEAEAWLDRHDIKAVFTGVDGYSERHSDGVRNPADVAGLSEDRLSGMLYGMIDDADGRFFSGNIRFMLFFDHNDRLVGSLVNSIVDEW